MSTFHILSAEHDKIKFKFCRCGCRKYILAINKTSYSEIQQAYFIFNDYLATKDIILYVGHSTDHFDIKEIARFASLGEAKKACLEYDMNNNNREKINTILVFNTFSLMILGYEYDQYSPGSCAVNAKVLILNRINTERVIFIHPFYLTKTTVGTLQYFSYFHIKEKIQKNLLKRILPNE